MKTTQNTTGQSINKARLNPGRQWVAINNVEWPVEVQPRAGIDMEWVRQLSEFRKEGSEFPPIKVFQTPEGRLIGAEGHHRSLAMFKADEDQILCDVVDGTMEDAIVFAAGSNRSNGVKPMGPKDITKAVEMLLAIDEWWKKPATTIAGYVGCSPAKVLRLREKYARDHGLEIPSQIVGKDGRKRERRRTKAPFNRIKSYPFKGLRMYYFNHMGKKIASTNKKVVEDKFNELNACVGRMHRRSDKGIRVWLATYGFESVFSRGSEMLLRGLSGFWIPGIICASCDFSNKEALRLAIANLIAARRYKGDLTARMVVLCYPEDGPQKVIDLYRAEGFEFLTPEELAESLKAPGDSADGGVSS